MREDWLAEARTIARNSAATTTVFIRLAILQALIAEIERLRKEVMPMRRMEEALEEPDPEEEEIKPQG
jgi:hypothetical protein